MRIATSSAVPFGQFGPKFVLFAALFALSLVAAVLLLKRVPGEYNASGQCLLDSQYTEVTETRGGSRTLSYRVSYNFVAAGERYSGTGTISRQPTTREATVYYMAANPRDNALRPTRFKDDALIAAGVAFLIAVIAYWRLRTHYEIAIAVPSRGAGAGVGDSGGEYLRMPRGKYDAGVYVAIAFNGQLLVAGTLLASVLSLVRGLQPTSDVALTLATVAAVWSTLWVYSDRWRCIEAYSSRFCSGMANLSLFYVPVVAFLYANYRALARLQGR